MPNIKPISDLRNYTEVLGSITEGEPLFLTKNGHGKFAVLNMTDYEKMTSTMKLLTKLHEGEQSAKIEGYKTLDDLRLALED